MSRKSFGGSALLRICPFARSAAPASNPTASSAKYSRNACFQPTTRARAANARSVSIIRVSDGGRTVSGGAWAKEIVANRKQHAAIVTRARKCRGSGTDDVVTAGARGLGGIFWNGSPIDDLEPLVNHQLAACKRSCRLAARGIADLPYVIAGFAKDPNPFPAATHGAGARAVPRVPR